MTTDGASSNFTFPGSDINADGNGDILWHNSFSGDLATWYADSNLKCNTLSQSRCQPSRS
jgi:hypothetical protein